MHTRNCLYFSLFFLLGITCFSCQKELKPNVIILHTDQWRAKAFGYAGDPNVKTPNIDRLAANSANVSLAVSGMPVCTPHRASVMTGQRPLTHGLFMNDVQLDTNAVSLASVYANAGYQTGYIGKWHLDGNGRSSFIPPGGRRQGFQYWKALECTHNYNNSAYYAGDSPEKKFWEGYDAIAQAKDAQQYIREHAKGENPFLLFLSWGTPHAPYQTAPQKYQDMYDPEQLKLHPNVPPDMEEKVRQDLAGYYAHCTALDDMVDEILQTIEEADIADNTIILFTSDHGDLLGSHRAYKKQQAYEESIRIPMLIRAPQLSSGEYKALINSYDIMPTLLGLSGIKIPETVEGDDYSHYLKGKASLPDTATVLSCVQPFGQWNRFDHGGREYRGLRTLRYTYTRDLNGPWQLFDNEQDPYQMNNLIDEPAYDTLQAALDALLMQKLRAQGDEFRPGMEYIAEWGYEVDERQTVPYTP
ncbi:arylsulfatase A-like enzyme [Catalinimonas alkaloidigena]|uniref:sulfatase family protein n=1 Tax=Catalinimonas alkaloidigena TaxID=1075417 RepID=UPI0024063235|nr:sulfatase [Catalinimonas alkaloidigena]MDF9799487.1 arylsulfatase A-like enzyme [Catalinimonas alkaloidigena]